MNRQAQNKKQFNEFARKKNKSKKATTNAKVPKKQVLKIDKRNI